jgi:hypothetical protein
MFIFGVKKFCPFWQWNLLEPCRVFNGAVTFLKPRITKKIKMSTNRRLELSSAERNFKVKNSA